MAVMAYHGSVENGLVRLEAGAILPENAKVLVVVPDAIAEPKKPRFDLAEMISRIPPGYQSREECSGKPVGDEEW